MERCKQKVFLKDRFVYDDAILKNYKRSLQKKSLLTKMLIYELDLPNVFAPAAEADHVKTTTFCTNNSGLPILGKIDYSQVFKVFFCCCNILLKIELAKQQQLFTSAVA